MPYLNSSEKNDSFFALLYSVNLPNFFVTPLFDFSKLDVYHISTYMYAKSDILTAAVMCQLTEEHAHS